MKKKCSEWLEESRFKKVKNQSGNKVSEWCRQFGSLHCKGKDTTKTTGGGKESPLLPLHWTRKSITKVVYNQGVMQTMRGPKGSRGQRPKIAPTKLAWGKVCSMWSDKGH